MCGLIGQAGPGSGRLSSVETATLLGRVKHRGPDSDGAAAADDYLLGHTRLAIQDLSAAAAQPFLQGDVTLTYNGELWNAAQINVGVRETTGDTEVVAKALDQYGVAALPRFDGMWALAWHDQQTGQIHLARDRWGKVPLYWSTDGATVYWASEYGALPHGLPAEPVKPGHIVTVDPGLGWVMADEPWDVATPLVDLEPEPETVLTLLRKGVRERLVGDRSIAFMLSGGLDSTFILALVREIWQGPLVAYTGVLDETSPDLQAARWVAAEFDVDLVEVPVPSPTEQTVREAVAAVEYPMKAQVEIALAHLPIMRRISEDGHAVCLSGEAADELFGGYGNMMIKASKADDAEYTAIKTAAVEKMSRGNFPRVNKVGMRYGVECRLPFMQSELVELALAATKQQSPPGKKLLKAAAKGVVPPRIISRPKETFQGGVGTAGAVSQLYASPVIHYNATARTLFGFLPRS